MVVRPGTKVRTVTRPRGTSTRAASVAAPASSATWWSEADIHTTSTEPLPRGSASATARTNRSGAPVVGAGAASTMASSGSMATTEAAVHRGQAVANVPGPAPTSATRRGPSGRYGSTASPQRATTSSGRARPAA